MSQAEAPRLTIKGTAEYFRPGVGLKGEVLGCQVARWHDHRKLGAGLNRSERSRFGTV